MYKILYTVTKNPINAHHTSKGLYTIPTDSHCISNKHVIHHVGDHHSCLAKKVFSQNPPSNFNLHYFSSYAFLTGRYPHHPSTTARVVNNEVRTSYITFCVQHNTNFTDLCFSVKCRTPDKMCTLYRYLQKCFPHEDILLKLLNHS